MLFGLAPEVRIEALEDTWAAYSPASGDTLQLNAEAATILELLATGPHGDVAICQILADDTGADLAEVAAALQGTWNQLETAGLIRVLAGPT